MKIYQAIFICVAVLFFLFYKIFYAIHYHYHYSSSLFVFFLHLEAYAKLTSSKNVMLLALTCCISLSYMLYVDCVGYTSKKLTKFIKITVKELKIIIKELKQFKSSKPIRKVPTSMDKNQQLF